MSSRGSTRGGRGSRAGRGGRGASATAATPSTRPSIEDGTPASSAGGDVTITDAPAARAATTDAAQSATQSPAPAASGRARFRPKNIRRDAAERQKLEEERNRDLQAKIKIEEREQRDADRRARRGGRGRGRGRGDAGGHFVRRTVTAEGVFSGISQDMVKQGGGAWGQRSGGAGFKKEGQTEWGPRYQNRRANEVRVNVDSLRDSHAPEENLGASSKASGILPVGIIRVEHKAEDLKVATSAELEAEEQEDDDDDDLFVSTQDAVRRDIEMADDNEVWNVDPSKPEEHKDVKIKPEPGTEEDVDTEMADVPVKPDIPSSPELQKKPLAEDMDAKTKAKEKKREKALQDREIQAMAYDAASLLQGLSIKEGDAQDRDNKLFLFQFPPILPPLLHLNADGNEIVELEDDKEADKIRIKPEPGTSGPISLSSARPSGGGFIGKLNVRKSGKVELDWGGRILDLGIATDTDFLTTAIIVDEQENDLASGQGKATAMGRIYGKFVATPIFEEEADWEPDLEALNLSV
ncbi:hypothetical protein JX266_006747 [Neoarthrinium moseri]|uniref:uncharacterized protein n=1 Tax=Neoarthrinium moseri TaxID=1658444 RepID=UPI001FDB8ACE|nr:uncharacterized protein JN550_010403 [Neoarthrinium moseri]KAI1847207.1 hypothetical protein JX266_006747 [Neoarthrinium moseri]KAI1862247.1 hypothetical protein JN550_010403 [Neoarthrinium moseri]